MVKETDIKQSLTYSTLKRFNYVYGAFMVFPIALLLGSIGSDNPAIIVLPIIMILILSVLIIRQVIDMRTMVKRAKTFEECSGRVATIAEGYLRYARVVIVFKDFMNEEHRMTTHHLFMVYELPDYMEKDLIVYYSKDYPKVLIGSIVKDETQEEDSNGMDL